MFRIFRMLFALLVANAIQTTIMPYVKLWGVTPDIFLCALLSLTIQCGKTAQRTIGRIYAGLSLGIFASLLLEATHRGAPGLTTVIHTLAGLYGALVPAYLDKRVIPGIVGKKARKRVTLLVPPLLIAAGVMASEAMHVVYTYLSGVDLSFYHVLRVLISMLMAFLVGGIGHYTLSQWVDKPFQQTGIGKMMTKHIHKKKPKPAEP